MMKTMNHSNQLLDATNSFEFKAPFPKLKITSGMSAFRKITITRQNKKRAMEESCERISSNKKANNNKSTDRNNKENQHDTTSVNGGLQYFKLDLDFQKQLDNIFEMFGMNDN